MRNAALSKQFWFMAVVGAFLVASDAEAQLRSLRGGRMQRGARAAQQEEAADGEDEGRVKIERMPSPGKASMIRTPEFNVNVNGLQSPVSSRRREWALFEIKYSTSARWMDELTFTYHLLTKGKDDKGQLQFSYYTLAVRYQDIPKGDHMSCVALPPSQVERYGQPVALALEISGKSEVLAAEEKTSGMTLGKEWWKNSKIMDDPKLKRRNGLVDRSKTPFFLINSDDYEVVQ